MCASPATKLCDRPVPFDELHEGRVVVAYREAGGTEWEVNTCDLPMCDAHAVVVGKTYACGGGTVDIDTVDYCFGCARAEGKPVPAVVLIGGDCDE